MHWADQLASRVAEELRARGKDVYIFNGGLSVSGLQHIGRLRGEIILGEIVRRILEKQGLRIRQYITLYTQDAWKGKKPQREAFPKGEGDRYVGWPLIRVPDPHGCHNNWVDHYWEDFGPYIEKFTDGRIEVITTTEMYRGPLKQVVKEIMSKKEEVRRIINKYRARKPYPEGWIPFEPICAKCGRIDTTRSTRIVDGEHVEYVCDNCGHRGVASIEEGKLNWRLEWAGVWKALNVDFEPFGKDHAAPGGSRDSCVELSREILGYEPPAGQPYEWVAIRTRSGVSDMSSSGFSGITPREWLQVAHAEILRFLYLSTPVMRKVVINPLDIPQYYSRYYRAMRLHHKMEGQGGEEAVEEARSYELAQLTDEVRPVPEIPYLHAALLVQVLPRENRVEEAVRRLKRSGHLPENPEPHQLRWAETLLEKAARWVEKYAPPNLKITVLDRVTSEIAGSLTMRDRLRGLADALERVEPWTEEGIKQAMIQYTQGYTPQERRQFYREFYEVFLGRDSGPRAAPLLAVLDKRMVVERLRNL